MDEGLDRPWRGDADGVLDSSSLSAPGTRSVAKSRATAKGGINTFKANMNKTYNF